MDCSNCTKCLFEDMSEYGDEGDYYPTCDENISLRDEYGRIVPDLLLHEKAMKNQWPAIRDLSDKELEAFQNDSCIHFEPR